jgi:Sulfotransferase domain
MTDAMNGRALPTFIIIGAQKSATRWLRTNLGRHPDIFTARSELSFWNNARRVERLGFDGYREQFVGWNGEPIVGEATPGYMIWRHHPARVAQRLKEQHPDVRLIAVLRNPIDRAQSAMLHHIRRQRLPAGSRLLDLVREFRPPESDWFCLVSGGWYAASLEPFVDRFGDRLLVLSHDDVANDPARPFAAALRHVGADPAFVPDDLARVIFSNQRGRASRKSPLPVEDRAELWDYFRDDVARLERILGLDLSSWAPDESGPTD